MKTIFTFLFVVFAFVLSPTLKADQKVPAEHLELEIKVLATYYGTTIRRIKAIDTRLKQTLVEVIVVGDTEEIKTILDIINDKYQFGKEHNSTFNVESYYQYSSKKMVVGANIYTISTIISSLILEVEESYFRPRGQYMSREKRQELREKLKKQWDHNGGKIAFLKPHEIVQMIEIYELEDSMKFVQDYGHRTFEILHNARTKEDIRRVQIQSRRLLDELNRSKTETQSTDSLPESNSFAK